MIKVQTEINNSAIRNPHSELPQGWRWVKLREVCSIHPGQHILEADYNRKGIGIGYLTGPDDFGKESPNITKWTENPKAWCESSDVLVTVKGAGVGKTNLAPNERVAIGRQLMAVRPKPGQIDHIFLYHVLITCFSKLQGSALGSTVPGLGRGNIETLEFPCPPLLEQKRIASKLQELMQEVECARTAYEKELEAAKALPSAYLREVFESEEAKKWERKRLGEVCEFSSGKFIQKEKVKSQGAYPVYGANGIIGFTDERIFDKEVIIIGRVGSCGMVNKSVGPAWITDNTIVLEPLNQVTFDFLYWKLKSLKLEELRAASVQPLITQKDLKPLLILLPPLLTQQRIAQDLKEKMIQVENLQSSTRNQESALNALPQAILRKAFRGEL